MFVIDSVRTFSVNYLTETATVTRNTGTVDELGGLVTSMSTVGAYRVRLAPIKGSIARDAERVAPKSTAVVYTEAQTDIVTGDTLTINGMSFRVLETEFSTSSSLFVRLFCAEV